LIAIGQRENPQLAHGNPVPARYPIKKFCPAEQVRVHGAYQAIETANGAQRRKHNRSGSQRQRGHSTLFRAGKTGWGMPADHSAMPLTLAKGFNTLHLTSKTEVLGYLMSTLTIR
jgi:hypothetical protein